MSPPASANAGTGNCTPSFGSSRSASVTHGDALTGGLRISAVCVVIVLPPRSTRSLTSSGVDALVVAAAVMFT